MVLKNYLKTFFFVILARWFTRWAQNLQLVFVNVALQNDIRKFERNRLTARSWWRRSEISPLCRMYLGSSLFGVRSDQPPPTGTCEFRLFIKTYVVAPKVCETIALKSGLFQRSIERDDWENLQLLNSCNDICWKVWHSKWQSLWFGLKYLTASSQRAKTWGRNGRKKWQWQFFEVFWPLWPAFSPPSTNRSLHRIRSGWRIRAKFGTNRSIDGWEKLAGEQSKPTEICYITENVQKW